MPWPIVGWPVMGFKQSADYRFIEFFKFFCSFPELNALSCSCSWHCVWPKGILRNEWNVLNIFGWSDFVAGNRAHFLVLGCIWVKIGRIHKLFSTGYYLCWLHNHLWMQWTRYPYIAFFCINYVTVLFNIKFDSTLCL